MRVTNQMMLNSMKLYLSRNMTSLTKSQDMLASGHRISKPSDDPIGTINTMRFSTNILETEEYLEKIDQSTNFMDTTDAALNNVNSVLQRVRELVVYAANGTHNDESRKAIADEISQLREHLQMVSNTTFGNKSIFSGTNVTSAPYDADNDVWVGNSGKVELEIGSGVKIQINSVMQKYFYNSGSSLGGQTVDLTRLSSTDKLLGKTFNLVFDDREKNSRFISVTQGDIDNTGCPTEQDFVQIVQSSLGAAHTFTSSGGNFSLDGTPIYMTVNGHNIRSSADLYKIENYADMTTGNLEFFDDLALTNNIATTTIAAADIAAAPGWQVPTNDFDGWGHPSEKDFLAAVNSALGGSATLSYSAGKFYLSSGATTEQVYMNIGGPGGINLYNGASLAQLQSHTDLSGGTLNFFTDQDMATPTGAPLPAAVDVHENDIEKAVSWCLPITRTQFNTIARNMASSATATGLSLEYDEASGNYTLDGKAGDLMIDGVEVNTEYLQTVDDHSALLGKTLTFVPVSSSSGPIPLGSFDAAKIAVSDWGLSPTGEQYKGIMQNAINRSIGLLPDGKPRVLVSGTQDTGYSMKIMDQSLLPADGTPTQVKIRTLANESLGTFGYAGAAMALTESELESTIGSYFQHLFPENKYNVTCDFTTSSFTIAVNGGVAKTGSVYLVDEAGNRELLDQVTDVPAASKLLGKKMIFVEAGLGGNTWPTTSPGLPYTNDHSSGQPYLTENDLPVSILTMNSQQLVDNITAALKNLSSAHTLEVTGTAPNLQIDGMDGIKGTITLNGIAINDVNDYLTTNGTDFSKLIGQAIMFKPDDTAVTGNVITYMDAKTGKEVQESLALFTMGGQGTTGRGVRYQDDDIGLFQLMDRIVIDVKSGNHDNIDSNLGILDERMNTLNSERSIIGARVNRLDLQKDRMLTSKENYTTLLARYFDADMAQIIMDLNMQENVYRASLAAGARIIQPSLIDFLN